MTSVLLRCISHFTQLPNSITCNHRKKLINFVIQWYHVPFVVSMRNLTSLTKETKMTKENTLLCHRIFELEQEILNQGWVETSKMENILSDINDTNDIYNFQTNLLLQWCNLMDCLPKRKLEIIDCLWAQLCLCSFHLNSSHYNALLEIYLSNEHDFSPDDLLNEMRCKQIVITCEVYEKCLQYYCTKGNVTKALDLWQSMKQLHILSPNIYHLLITGYSEIGDFDKVQEILKIMEEKNIKENISIYTTLMCAYAKTNNINKIEDLIRFCNYSEIHIPNKTIINVIYTLAKYNKMQYMCNMYNYLTPSSSFCKNELSLMLKLISKDELSVVQNILKRTRNLKLVEIILKNVVHHCSDMFEVFDMCNFLHKNKMSEDPLLLACYNSFRTKSNKQCLVLLQACKKKYSIKSHYFWPLIINEVQNYNFGGVIDILRIMITEFQIVPCFDTLVHYVVPYSYGNTSILRYELLKLNINIFAINNAFLLNYLRKPNIQKAANYIKFYEGKYSYNLVINDLTNAFFETNNIEGFMCISKYLIEFRGSDDCISSNLETLGQFEAVSIEKQLNDFMDRYPDRKMQLKRIATYLAKKNINVSLETAKRIEQKLQEFNVKGLANNILNNKKRLQAC